MDGRLGDPICLSRPPGEIDVGRKKNFTWDHTGIPLVLYQTFKLLLSISGFIAPLPAKSLEGKVPEILTPIKELAKEGRVLANSSQCFLVREKTALAY